MKNNPQKTFSHFEGHPVLNLSSNAAGELVNEFMNKKKILKLKTKGHSMNPIIQHGDIITISPYFKRLPCIGDIVAYINPVTRGLIIHRLIRINDDLFVARGDNCKDNDIAYKTTCIMGYVSNINGETSLKNNCLLPKTKKILVFFSKNKLLFILNKFLQKLNLPSNNEI